MLIKVLLTIFFLIFSSTVIAESQMIPISGPDEKSSYQSSMTPDGRYIVYVSDSKRYPSQYSSDIYLYDRENNTTRKISGSLSEENGYKSVYPSISNDGRYIVYQSNSSSNQSTSSSAGFNYIYLYDRALNKTRLVSTVDNNENSFYGHIFPKISGNGQSIIYVSSKTQLENEILYLYQIDTQQQSTINTRDCSDSGMDISFPDISDNGELIVFTKGNYICVYNTKTQKNSIVYNGDQPTHTIVGEIYHKNIFSTHPHISSDGRYITFESYYSKFQFGTDSLFGDIHLAAVYLYDLLEGTLKEIYQEKNKLRWLEYDSIDGSDIVSIGIHGELQGLSAYISADNKFVLLTGTNSIDSNDQYHYGGALLYSILDNTIKRVTFNEYGSPFGAEPGNFMSVATDIGMGDRAILGITKASNLSSFKYDRSYKVFFTNNQWQNHFPNVSSQVVQKNDILSIQFQQTEPGYLQYIGIQTPDEKVYLIDQKNQLIPYNGHNLTQGLYESGKAIQFTINEQLPSGTYQILSLMKPEPDNITVSSKGLVKTKVNVNDIMNRSIKVDDKCVALIKQFNGFIRDYDELNRNILFSSEQNIISTYTDNKSDDLFVCDNKSGDIKLVSLDNNGEPFPDGMSHFQSYYQTQSKISDNGEWMVFGKNNIIYLHNILQQTTLSKVIYPVEQNYCDPAQISRGGNLVLFSCRYNDPDGSNFVNIIAKFYIWDIRSDSVKDITDKIKEQGGIPWRFKEISPLEKQFGFAAINDNRQIDLFIYDIIDNSVEKINNNFINESPEIYSTLRFDDDILHFTKDNQKILLKYRTINDQKTPYAEYFALYDRQSKTNQLLKIADTEDFLKVADTTGYSLSEDGRFFLFQSVTRIPTGNDKIALNQSPFIYLYDRESQKLKQIDVESGNKYMENSRYELHQYMKISDDALSFRLKNKIYPLPDRPIIANKILTQDDIFHLSLSESPKGYKQYFGLQYPNGELYIYTSPEARYLYDGNNLIPYQDKRVVFNELIKWQWPPGIYHAYLLTLPETTSPLRSKDEWILGETLFEIK